MIFQSSNNYKINYEVDHADLSQDTVFIHGNLSSNVWWEPTRELLRKSTGKNKLVFAEWRGCGKSEGPKSTEDLKVESLAQDYIDLCKSLSNKKFNLVGHSTGGIIALKALTIAPELFNKVVLLDPVAPWGFQAPAELMAAFDQMSKDKAFCAMIMNTTIHNNNQETALFKKIVDDAFNVHPLIWRGVPGVLSKIDFRNDLGRIKSEVLILHGEHDQILSKKDSEELVKLLVNSKYVELKGQGHSCNVENPSLFVSYLKDFL